MVSPPTDDFHSLRFFSAVPHELRCSHTNTRTHSNKHNQSINATRRNKAARSHKIPKSLVVVSNDSVVVPHLDNLFDNDDDDDDYENDTFESVPQHSNISRRDSWQSSVGSVSTRRGILMGSSSRSTIRGDSQIDNSSFKLRTTARRITALLAKPPKLNIDEGEEGEWDDKRQLVSFQTAVKKVKMARLLAQFVSGNSEQDIDEMGQTTLRSHAPDRHAIKPTRRRPFKRSTAASTAADKTGVEMGIISKTPFREQQFATVQRQQLHRITSSNRHRSSTMCDRFNGQQRAIVREIVREQSWRNCAGDGQPKRKTKMSTGSIAGVDGSVSSSIRARHGSRTGGLLTVNELAQSGSKYTTDEVLEIQKKFRQLGRARLKLNAPK